MTYFMPSMVRSSCPSAVIVLFMTMPSTVAAEEVTPVQIREWIGNLAAHSFVQREIAAQKLLATGEPAISFLESSAKSPDREVRDRSKQILSILQERRRDTIVARFRKASKSDTSNGIPGWRAFSGRYGDGSVARELYAEMLEAEWSLLSSVFSLDGDKETNVITRRFEQIQGSRNARYLATRRGTVMTFFVLAANYPEQISQHGQLFSFFAPGQPISRMLIEGPATDKSERQLIRKIVGDWLLAATQAQHLDDHVALQATILYQMGDIGSIIGQRVLKEPKSLVRSKEMAMQAIVLRNDVSQAPLIERYLSDTTRLGSKENRHRQLRDVALACLMKLHGHDPALIGVRTGQTSIYQAFEYGSIGFTSEAEREKAFQTYRRLQHEKRKKAKQPAADN